MKNYDCIQDGSTAARSRFIGKIGEELAEQTLELSGFTKIENLNKSKSNHQYPDIYAEKDGERYVISVKTRNKFQANGVLNPDYNFVESGDIDYARQAMESRNAKAAWVAISLEDATFDAYFGLLSSLPIRGNDTAPRKIPMRPINTKGYLCLAKGAPHGENPSVFKNKYKRKSDISVIEAPIKEHTIADSI